ncbi:methylated-DNA--[protein]-cysteine S-methyltransferase [Lacimicrobium alkaliphilum]|uniref:Methylated-DNA--protein-cysteine methyltransferase n=1 Tax=Lacimicrobium alkaliphilum TaxID=1526571 RepID=A0ABQ1RV00_9ALTE|nr:methylated-DNA--[protein]-cysteine S-methyltransferase [Lacimicrobium alkaliphilum]GGD78967.1 methylated-DNA--protein-cysteine methyltransferase [Lacimicrobium alkaliphilum]
MNSTFMRTPIGLLAIRAIDNAISHIAFVDRQDAPAIQHPLLVQAREQLQQYFAGQRQAFSLPLAATGTEFQHQVWQALARIPYAQTASYGQIAESIGKPKAVRAVGAANGRNPLAIVVPCHRIIGKDGKLTGYAGGLERKAWLLALEQG